MLERYAALPAVEAQAEMLETATMARPADGGGGDQDGRAQGGPGAVPLLRGARVARRAALRARAAPGRGALRESLLTQLGLAVGDQIKIGTWPSRSAG